MASETRHWPLTLWPTKATVHSRLAPGQVISPLAALNAREAQLVRELARLLGLSLLLVALVAGMMALTGVILPAVRQSMREMLGDEPLHSPAQVICYLGQLLNWARPGLVPMAILAGLSGLALWWLTPRLPNADLAIARWPVLRRYFAAWDWRRYCAGMSAKPSAVAIRLPAERPPPASAWARLPAVRCQAELSQTWASTWHDQPATWPRHWAACPKLGRLLLGHGGGHLTSAQWAALGEQLEGRVDDGLRLWRIWLQCLFYLLLLFLIALTTLPWLLWFLEITSRMNSSNCFG